MTNATRLLAVAVLISAATAPSDAQSRDSLLVSPQWLHERLGQPGLVVLHAGQSADYQAGHVPGARFAPLSSISRAAGEEGKPLNLELMDPDALRASLEQLGISDNSRIVVVFGEQLITSATRILFTLDYAGLGARSSLLDGGLNAWKAAGYETTTDVPPPAPGRLSPLRIADRVVANDVVREAASRGVVVVDARAPMFYNGEREAGPAAARRTGHIPGARSVPFSSVVNDKLQLLSADSLSRVFLAAGVKAGDSVVTYCHIGQQATLVTLAARLAGLSVRVYDGSMEDWAWRGLPMELPTGKP